MAKPLSEWGTNWQNSAGTAGTNYAAGVQGTDVDVVGRAIAAQGAMVANFTQSVSNGTWARNLSAVGTQGWKTATLAKVTNYQTGFQAGANKYNQAMQTWGPRITSIAAAAKAMPGGTTENRIARSVYLQRQLHAAKVGG